MACETYTTIIDEHDITYTQLTAKKSAKLKFKLAGVLGESLSDLVAAMSEKEDTDQIKSIGVALSSIFGKHSPDEIMNLIENIMVPAFFDGKRIDIDEHFTGNLTLMYKVLAWILQKEYGDFFGGALNLIQK